jgi:hypothetical protein
MQPNGLPEFRPRRHGVSYATPIAERMRQFRLRHPGYDREYKAKQRAKLKAMREARELAERLAQAELQAQPAPLAICLPEYRLCLPAPVVDPMMLELNALAAKLARAQQAAEIPAPEIHRRRTTNASQGPRPVRQKSQRTNIEHSTSNIQC